MEGTSVLVRPSGLPKSTAYDFPGRRMCVQAAEQGLLCGL